MLVTTMGFAAVRIDWANYSPTRVTGGFVGVA
jgi:hypothetical protein